MTVQATQKETEATPVSEPQDETASFDVVTSDVPEPAEPEAQETETKPDGEAESKGDEKPEPGEGKEEEAAKHGDDSTAETQKPGKKGKGFQKRIDEVVRERETERQRADRLQKELDQLKKGDKAEKPDSKKEPKESDFDSYDEYLDALDKWDQDTNSDQGKPEKAEKDADKSEDKEADGSLTDSQKTAMAVLKERFDEERDNFEDFDKVAFNEDLAVSPVMLEALAECEEPSKVLYHLGKNPELSKEISEKSPTQVMREITKLDLDVGTKPAKPVKTTQAADPISPVGKNAEGQKAVGDMSFSEYEAYMNEQEQKGEVW